MSTVLLTAIRNANSLQTKSVTALDFIFHSRRRTTAFLFGEAGEKHAQQVRRMQVKQIWALWEVGSALQYSPLWFQKQILGGW